MYTYKIVIHPNNKQKTMIRNTMNKCIECHNIILEYLYSFLDRGVKIPSCGDVRKWFTKEKVLRDLKIIEERQNMTHKEQREKHLFVLFSDVSNDALKQEIKDAYNSFIRCFKKIGGKPNFKSFSNYRKSFYVDPYKIKFTSNKVKLEKLVKSLKFNKQVLNWVKLAEKDRIPTGCKYYNPRIILDKDNFYLVVTVDDEFAPKKNRNIVRGENILGIDVNIKKVVTSDNEFFTTPSQTDVYKTVEERLKTVEKVISRKQEIAKKENRSLKNNHNYRKVIIKKRVLQERLNNLKIEFYYKTIYKILKSSPKIICLEELDVKEMKESKNKLVRKGLQKNPFRKFLDILEYKCGIYGIDVIHANEYYPSSKKCSCCGKIKKDLTLEDRVYKCNYCQLVIDRDLNAAINLKNYVFLK